MNKKSNNKILIYNKEDKQVLLKLVNQYADSYQYLLSENKKIKLDNSHLKSSLKINQHIVDSLLKGKEDNIMNNVEKHVTSNLVNINMINREALIDMSKDTVDTGVREKNSMPFSFKDVRIHTFDKKDKSKNSTLDDSNLQYKPTTVDLVNYINKLKEENNNLQAYLDDVNKEYNELLNKSSLQDHAKVEIESLLREENKKLKNENFKLENDLYKSECEWLFLKKCYGKDDFKYVKEALVERDPNSVVIALNSELAIFKELALKSAKNNELVKEKYRTQRSLNEVLLSDNIKLAKKVKEKNLYINDILKKESVRPENNLNTSLFELGSSKINFSKIANDFDLLKKDFAPNKSDRSMISSIRPNIKEPIDKKNKVVSDKDIQSYLPENPNDDEKTIRKKLVRTLTKKSNKDISFNLQDDIMDSSFESVEDKNNIEVKVMTMNSRKNKDIIFKKSKTIRKRKFTSHYNVNGMDYEAKDYVGKLWKNIIFENGLNYKQILNMKNNYIIKKLLLVVEQFKKKYEKNYIETQTLEQENYKKDNTIMQLREEILKLKNNNRKVENLLRDGISSFKSPILTRKISNISNDFQLSPYIEKRNSKIDKLEDLKLYETTLNELKTESNFNQDKENEVFNNL